MPEAQCIKYPIKPGHSETLVNWIARLGVRSKELSEALAEGGIVAEAVFLEKSDKADYILIYTRAQDLRAAIEKLSKSKTPLIQEFNEFLAGNVDIEDAVTLGLIYHTP